MHWKRHIKQSNNMNNNLLFFNDNARGLLKIGEITENNVSV